MRKRNIRIDFMVNDLEYTKLIDDVTRSKSNISVYLRKLIMGYQIKEKPDEKFYEFLKELTAMGNNINQIARKANSTNIIDKKYYQDNANEWNKFVSQIRKEYL